MTSQLVSTINNINLASVFGLLIFVGLAIATGRKDERWYRLFAILIFSFPFLAANGIFVHMLAYVMPVKEDLYFFRADALLGQPSFYVGQMFIHHLWLGYTSIAAYMLLPIPMYILVILYSLTKPRAAVIAYVRTFALSFLLAIPLYMMVPVAGPIYAFKDGFPFLIPTVTNPHEISFFGIPNGFPSVHISTALLIAYFSRPWKVGTAVSSVYLVFIILATLGTGEHYAVDLIAGGLYTALVIWLGAERDKVPATDPRSVTGEPKVKEMLERISKQQAEAEHCK